MFSNQCHFSSLNYMPTRAVFEYNINIILFHLFNKINFMKLFISFIYLLDFLVSVKKSTTLLILGWSKYAIFQN